MSSRRLKFIERANIIHKNKYDYSLVDYKNTKTKVSISCPIHGEFITTPTTHIDKKCGCPKCPTDRRNLLITSLLLHFIEKANTIHRYKYDYSLAVYKNIHTKIKIICPIHGLFEQSPANHISRKSGCPICKYDTAAIHNLSMNTADFIERCTQIHGNKYDYSKVIYKGHHKKIEVICPGHGPWFVKANNHIINKSCCPGCKTSRGEERVSLWLTSNNIDYISQYKMKGCSHKRLLSFDFFLPDHNMCIEYDGIQHTNNTFNSSPEEYKLCKLRDQIKSEFCNKNNIELLRINYTQFDDIEIILVDHILKHYDK